MKKLNIGIILIFLVIVFLSIYLINEEKYENQDKKNVEAICREYIKLHSKYFMLEEEYRDINKVISNEEYNKYLDGIRKEILVYVSSERVDYTFERYKEILDEQLDGRYILKQYDRNITEIISYKIDGEYINVTFMVEYFISKDNRLIAQKNESTGRYYGEITSKVGKTKLFQYMIFKKIGNEYKVVVDTTQTFHSKDLLNDFDK